jgi:hypothetical protein
MEVNLFTIMAGPRGILQPGRHNVDEKTAHDLIAGGFAEAVNAREVSDKKFEEALAQRRADIAAVKAPPKDEGELQPGPAGKKGKAA